MNRSLLRKATMIPVFLPLVIIFIVERVHHSHMRLPIERYFNDISGSSISLVIHVIHGFPLFILNLFLKALNNIEAFNLFIQMP